MFHMIHPGSESDSTSGTIAIGANFERNYEARLPIPWLLDALQRAFSV
jgi:hypothetical protein